MSSWWIAQRAVPVPMSDGVTLRADLYRPPHGRAPAVLYRTPYGRSDLNRWRELDPLATVAEGFAVVIQDVRGRGGSSGPFQPFRSDVQDGQQTIDWICAQPWSDGRVVMVGESFSGLLQLQASKAGCRGLYAIAPTMSGALMPGWYPGGALALGRMTSWLDRLLSEACATGVAGPELVELRDAAPLELFHQFLTPGTAAYRAGAPLRHWIDAARDRRWRAQWEMPERPVPAFHTTGYYDLCATATLRAFQDWTSRGVPEAPQFLTIGPWGHVLGEAPNAGLLGVDVEHVWHRSLLDRRLAFFRGLLGSADEFHEPRVHSYVIGRNRWHESDTWPVRGARGCDLHLRVARDGSGILSIAAARRASVASYVYDPRNPVPTWGGANAIMAKSGPTDQSCIEQRPDVLVFTSSAVDRSVEVAGSPVVHLRVRSSADATTFFARLTMVRLDGTSINLAEGSWSGLLRDLPESAAASYRSCSITLGPVHVLLATGFRLRLQVTSSNFPDLYPDPNTGHDLRDGPPPKTIVAHQQMLVGGPHGSVMTCHVMCDSSRSGSHPFRHPAVVAA